MAQKVIRWLTYLGVFLVLGSLVWGIYAATSLYIAATATVKLGVLTALISVGTLIYNNMRQQAREIRARHFVEKRQAYQKFFDFMFEMFLSQRRSHTISEAETIERMQAIVKDLMIWGSAETINQYNSFIRASVNPQDGGNSIFLNVESLMRSFRRDLGHDDRKLERLGLTKLLVKGEEHDALGSGR